MPLLKKISLVLLIAGYTGAGINHFRVPAFYKSIIPSYLPYSGFLNILAGVLEIAFGLMLIFPRTRKFAAWAIIFLLIAFLPVHIAMLSGHTELNGKPVLPLWAWARLFLQPVLILWAWWHTRVQVSERRGVNGKPVNIL